MANKPDGYFYFKNGKLRYVDGGREYVVKKSQIERFKSVVDTNPGKWKKYKVNSQIIDNHEFHFIYTEYEDNPMDNVFMITRYRRR